MASCMKTLLQCVESVASKMQPCIVANFERLQEENAAAGLASSSQHKLVYMRNNPVQPIGNWPLPEPFPPDAILDSAGGPLV